MIFFCLSTALVSLCESRVRKLDCWMINPSPVHGASKRSLFMV